MRDVVIHGPTGLELDFAAEDFGDERGPAIIAAALERGHTERGEFICYYHRNHERPDLYLQRRDTLIVAAHWPGSGLSGTHEISHGVSDEHKRQVEYIARAGAAAGFDVAAEVRLPTKVRSDAVIYGPTAMGVEVQRSKLTARAAKARTTKARHSGVMPIWFSDTKDPEWFGAVPGVCMNEQPWDTVPRVGSVTVVSGVRLIKPQRCQDIRNGQCPRRRYGCNRWHATHEPRLPTFVDDLAALIPNGDLLPILFKSPSGKRTEVLIVSRNDKARYEAMQHGASADLPLRQRQQANRSRKQITCAANAGAVTPAALVTDAAAVVPAQCCDEQPLVLSCQLCPSSPTYWRREK